SLFFLSLVALLFLHSFPTRRSSDLFLFSLYVLDANSAAAAAKMKRAALPLLLTDLGKIEVLNAIGLRLCRKELRPVQAKKVYDLDRKSTRLNSSHRTISYAVFCLKK